MKHEISQFDIPDHHLLGANAQQRVGMWKDIGEAKITHTIFGKAKVRIIRKRDKKRRAWLLTALVLTAMGIASWQGWIAFQQMQSAALPRPLIESIRVSAPIIQSVDSSLLAIPPSARSRPESQVQSETGILLPSPKSALQPSDVLKPAEQKAVKLVTPQPLIAVKPQMAPPPPTNNNTLKNTTGMQQPPKPLDPIQRVAPAVASPPQPVTNKPANVAPLVEPLIKRDTSAPPPAGEKQPPETVNVQP